MAAAASVSALRQDLGLSETGYDASGLAGYVIHDPLRHKFFRLPASVLPLLRHWRAGPAGTLATDTGVAAADIAQVAQFLSNNRLLVVPAGGVSALIEERQRSEKSVLAKLLHNYLFFRVPLFDPTRLIDALLPLARRMVSWPVLTVLAVAFIFGSYFAVQQWDRYLNSFINAWSLDGAIMFGITLMVLKVFHELGHGLVARAHGVTVPTMGVAFMLLAPMLYTEVSDASRLKNRWARFAIAGAGVGAELVIAILSLLLWAFLPDGGWRNIAFFVSSTAWITSLLINLSPFMRFDGYHMLGDCLALYNIGPRAFALANWKLKELLFGLGDAPPEMLRRGLQRFLIGFAWGTMMYRLTLFLGIAYLVYTMLPKALGLPLALVEVIFFIVLPVWREIKAWIKDGVGRLFRPLRAKLNFITVIIFVGLCFLPLDRHVGLPGVLIPALETRLHAAESAEVKQVFVKDGSIVMKGDVLAVLHSPALEQEVRIALLRQEIVASRLARVAADVRERSLSIILQQEKRELEETLAGLTLRRQRLTITAPFNGRISDVMPGLAAERWVSGADPLFYLAGEAGVSVIGLANERSAMRLAEHNAAVFVSDDGAREAMHLRVVSVGTPGGEGLEAIYLASFNGGPVAASKDPAGRTKYEQAMLPVTFFATGTLPQQAHRGWIVVEAKPESLAHMALGRVVSVALRESGF